MIRSSVLRAERDSDREAPRSSSRRWAGLALLLVGMVGAGGSCQRSRLALEVANHQWHLTASSDGWPADESHMRNSRLACFSNFEPSEEMSHTDNLQMLLPYSKMSSYLTSKTARH